jgi:hypothetical protein
MRLRLLSLLLAAFAVGLCCVCARAQGGGTQNVAPLTNASIVKLVRAGFREKTVIAIIAARPVNFDLTPERLIELKKGGVSEHVILAMIARAESVDLASEEWDDMPLDEGSGASGRQTGSGSGSDPGSVNIFGSSGGAHGRTRSRNQSGDADNDTQTVGSASVRIVRPPSEGGAQTKLERTPTLTNDSVVELVEAGFSEGTIVRRIEQSPVEFDLSPAKLSDLRKRRVGEPVIAAMRAAMGEDQNQPARPER